MVDMVFVKGKRPVHSVQKSVVPFDSTHLNLTAGSC